MKNFVPSKKKFYINLVQQISGILWNDGEKETSVYYMHRKINSLRINGNNNNNKMNKIVFLYSFIIFRFQWVF